jgi:parallel beta-helix repeat protein
MRKKFLYRLFLFCIVGLSILIIAFIGQKALSEIVSGGDKTQKPVEKTGVTNTSTSIRLISPTSSPKPTLTFTPTIEPERKQVVYVATDGSDLADGSLEHPWKTIQFAADHVRPGAVIFVREGIYLEGVHITVSGLSGNPILLSAYNDDSVMIDGGDLRAISGDADYWVVNGFILKSAADRVVRLNSKSWTIQSNTIYGAVYVWGDHNILVDNEIDGSMHLGNENGIMEDGPMSFGNVIRKNRIHDFNSRGIWSQWFTHESLIEGNTVFKINGNSGICIDLDGASSVVYRHIIRGNTVHDCAQSGIELENAYGTLVENNLIYHTGLEGIQIISYYGCQQGGINNQYGKADGECRGDYLDTTIQQNIIYDAGRVGGIVSYESSGVKVYNNTVYGGESVALFIKSSGNFSNNWDVRGNIFSNHDRAEISISDPTSFHFDENNLVDPKDPNHAYEVRGPGLIYYSLSQWQQFTSMGVNSIQNNSGFVDPSRNDFHLTSGSAAIDRGQDLGITLDFDGTPRPQLGGFDIGAYEFVIK